MRIDPKLEEAARPFHFTARTCSVCQGKGVLERPNINSPTGIERDDPCPGCDGNGVTWRQRDNLPEMSDRQMWDFIRRHADQLNPR